MDIVINLSSTAVIALVVGTVIISIIIGGVMTDNRR